MLYDNPDLYDVLQPASTAQLNFYCNLARAQAGAVLELGCGSGQIIVPIAALGRPAAGLDLSPEMLDAAQRRAVAASVKVEWIQGDMREFNLKRRFSLICVARNSLLHLSEPDHFAAFFSSVRRHLEPGGVLAFDIFNPSFQVITRPSEERYPLMHKTSALYGELTVEATSDYDRQSQVNRSTWFISTKERRDAWVVQLDLRSIYPQELLVLLALNSARLISRYGDFTGGVFTSKSPTQVCQCRFD